MLYQRVRFTLLNHKQALPEEILSSLNYLIEEKLIHKEWKRFEFELLSRFHQELVNQKLVLPTEEAITFQNQFHSIDSVHDLMDLLESETEQTTVKCMQIFHLSKILGEMEVDEAMIDEFKLYDSIMSDRTKTTLFNHLNGAYDVTDQLEEVMSIVFEWYSLLTKNQIPQSSDKNEEMFCTL